MQSNTTTPTKGNKAPYTRLSAVIIPALLLATNANAGLIEGYTGAAATYYGLNGINIIKADIVRLHKACGVYQQHACTNTENSRVMVNRALEDHPERLLHVICHEAAHVMQLRDGLPLSEVDANNRAEGCMAYIQGGDK